MEEIRLGLEFQSALPRRERHNCDTIKNRALLISIRAPAKGATRWLCTSDADQVISIRAPAKGATIKLYSIVARICNFNPRSREGSDLSGCTNLIILIHFNPRSREGSDSNIIQQFSFFCIILYILSVIT